ncbi:hypothetical protein RQL62_12545 [Citrobacter amalonaticus]|nr:hypothetical protein [Citrobacter amalonaticus]
MICSTAKNVYELPERILLSMNENQSGPEGQNSREWLRHWYSAVGDIAFNIIYIMRTNGKDGRIWPESLTLAVNWLLSTVIQNHPFLQTNQNQMSVSSK